MPFVAVRDVRFALSELRRVRLSGGSRAAAGRTVWSILVFIVALALPRPKYNSLQIWIRTSPERLRGTKREAQHVHIWLSGLTRGAVERGSVAWFIARLFWSRLAHISPEPGDVFIRIAGGKYAIARSSSWEIGALDELYREDHHSRVEDFVPKRGWTVVDAGANVGMYSVMQAARGARVVAIEANPDCYRRLCATLAKNPHAREVTALHCALGEKVGVGVMQVPIAEGHPATSIGTVQTVEASRLGGTPVSVLTLDLVTSRLAPGRIDLLKVAVEGAELRVLSGALETLARVERVVVECHSKSLTHDVNQLLSSLGFREICWVDVMPEQGVGLLYAAKQDHDRSGEPPSKVSDARQ